MPRQTKKKTKKGPGDRTHIEIQIDGEIVWPRTAYDELEAQIKGGIRAQIEGKPLANLGVLVDQAVKNLFVGIRVTKTGRGDIAVRSQEVELSMDIVDTRGGQAIRRRNFDLNPVTVTWPE